MLRYVLAAGLLITAISARVLAAQADARGDSEAAHQHKFESMTAWARLILGTLVYVVMIAPLALSEFLRETLLWGTLPILLWIPTAIAQILVRRSEKSEAKKQGAKIERATTFLYLLVTIACLFGAHMVLYNVLLLSAISGNTSDVKLLLALGLNPNGNDKFRFDTPLEEAAGNGHSKIVKLLVEHGATVNEKCTQYVIPPLGDAVLSNNAGVGQYLIQHRANVNALDWSGMSPLAYAAGTGNVAVAQLLIAHGANLQWTDTRAGTNLLMKAGASGHVPMAQFLISHGANVNGANRFRVTPLMFASGAGKLAMTQYLLSQGAKTGAVNVHGMTALMYAVQYPSVDVAQLLVDHGAKVNAEATMPLGISRTKTTVNALYLAERIHDAAMTNLLKRAGAKLNTSGPLR